MATDIFLRERLKIARKTVKLSRVGALVLGGMNHDEARELLAEHCDELENLDAMDVSEVRAIADDETQHSKLREYATVKAQAMAKRLAGDINTATGLERTCERIYDTLPAALRW